MLDYLVKILIFALTKFNLLFMENSSLPELDNELDIRHSKTSSSRFFFLLGFFGIFVFAWSGCYNLYTHSYKAAEVEITPSSQYNPQYK